MVNQPALAKVRVWEIVLCGFDGSTDATDDRVRWIATGSQEVLQAMQEHEAVMHAEQTDLAPDAAGVDLRADSVEELYLALDKWLQSSPTPQP